MKPSLILINPWIYDFAAYDLWSKPLGLLYMASYLRDCGFQIHFVDCLDVYHPQMWADKTLTPPKRRHDGTGKFWRKVIPKPSPLKEVPRPYSRYGLTPNIIENELRRVQNPKAILVTSLMTYWYPGVMEAISLAKKAHPGVPVLLGGIYARLCQEHASQFSGAEIVISEPEGSALFRVFRELGIHVPRRISHSVYQCRPSFGLLNRIEYVCLLTSIGCPYRCRYCASHFLNPKLIRRKPGEVLDEILYWYKDFGVRNFAFYDDALLVEAPIVRVLEELVRLDVRLSFHTPNAVHVREITPNVAKLMVRSGFRTVRLGFETADFSSRRHLDNKVSEGEFEKAVSNLHKAGYEKRDVGAYIMVGLPGQSVCSVEETIDFVTRTGAVPYLSEYSPIPHTDLWGEALKHSPYDLRSEPLFHNNTLVPCWDGNKVKEIPTLKRKAVEIRHLCR